MDESVELVEMEELADQVFLEMVEMVPMGELVVMDEMLDISWEEDLSDKIQLLSPMLMPSVVSQVLLVLLVLEVSEELAEMVAQLEEEVSVPMQMAEMVEMEVQDEMHILQDFSEVILLLLQILILLVFQQVL